jgi:hypothetical protein
MSKKESADPAIDLPPVGPILGSRGNRLSFPNTRPEEVKLVGDGSILVFSINYERKYAFMLKVTLKTFTVSKRKAFRLFDIFKCAVPTAARSICR